jgi:hypothetical protein
MLTPRLYYNPKNNSFDNLKLLYDWDNDTGKKLSKYGVLQASIFEKTIIFGLLTIWTTNLNW